MPDGESSAPAAEWRGTAIVYPDAAGPSVGPIDLRLDRGERVLLLGPSGSGKSSLLLALTGLIPQSVPAAVAGRTSIFGQASSDRRPADWADTVAHYFQDADQVLCGMSVKDEIAFALENQSLPEAEIEGRVAETMMRLGLPAEWLARRSLSMSGGERQLVALAAILAQRAPLLLADEPTAHLSPEAADRLHQVLAGLDAGHAALVVDHRLDRLLELVDRVVVLDGAGRVLAEGAPGPVFRDHHARLAAEGIWRPAASDLDARLREAGIALRHPPRDVAHVLQALDAGEFQGGRPEMAEAIVAAFVRDAMPPARGSASGGTVVGLKGADCAPFLGPTVLRGIDFAVRAGEIVVLLGRNGAGKSTLGASLAGLLRLKKGRRRGPPGAMAFQRPEDQFSASTVKEETASMLPKGVSAEERERRIRAALLDYRLQGLEERHPATLSEGQKRRLVLAAIDAADRWPLLVLDEPTAGLDAAGVAGLARRIEAMRTAGRGIVLITHDVDLALRLGDRVAIVGDGGIVADGPGERILFDAGLLSRNGLREPVAAPAIRWLRARPPR